MAMRVMEFEAWKNSLNIQAIENDEKLQKGHSIVQIMGSNQTQSSYKIIHHAISHHLIADDKKKLLVDIDLYNQAVEDFSKIQFCGTHRNNPEIIIARKIDSNEQSLRNMIVNRSITKKDLTQLAQDIVERIELIHQKGIVHGNISIDSIFVRDNDNATTLDPPLFKWIQKRQRIFKDVQNIYNPYEASEVRDKYCRSLASDVYSLGITFSQLFSGNLSEISESMKENNSEFLPRLNQVDDIHIRTILAAMISPDPSIRPSINEVSRALRGKIDLLDQNQKEQVTIVSIPLIPHLRQQHFVSPVFLKNAQNCDGFKFSTQSWEVQFQEFSRKNNLISFRLKGTPKLVYFHGLSLRFVNFLKSGVASLRIGSEGNLNITVAAVMKQVINFEHNLKEIKKYLTQKEEQSLENLSFTFKKIKNQMKIVEDSQVSIQLQKNSLKLTAEIWEKIGDQLFELKKQNQAIKLYKKIIELTLPRTYDIDGLGGHQDQQFGYEGRLYEWYEENRQKGKIKGSPFDALSLCYSISRNYEDGLNWYSKMIERYPNDYRLHYGLGNIEHNRFNFRKSEEIFKKVIDLKPNFDKPYQHIAYGCYIKVVNCQITKKQYYSWALKALQINPDNIQAGMLVAENKSTVEEMRIQFEKILLKNINPLYCKARMLSKCCRLASSEQEIQEGLKNLKEIEEKCPKNVWIQNSMAWLMSRDGKKYSKQQIVKFYARSIELKSHNWVNFYSLSILLGVSELAIKWGLEALQLNPFNELIYCHLGCLYAKMNQIYKALSYYHKALEISPLYWDCHYKLGYLYFYQVKDNMKAFYHFSKAVKICPEETVFSYYHMAQIHVKHNQLEEAIECLKKNLQFRPKDPTIYKLLGECQMRLKRYSEARDHFITVFELNPNEVDVKGRILSLCTLMGETQNMNQWSHMFLKK